MGLPPLESSCRLPLHGENTLFFFACFKSIQQGYRNYINGANQFHYFKSAFLSVLLPVINTIEIYRKFDYSLKNSFCWLWETTLNTFPQDFSTHLIVLFMSTNLKGVQEL